MMKILIAPDSFKGTLTAVEAAQAIAEGVKTQVPDANIELFPMADGGEGTLEIIRLALNGELFSAHVAGADGFEIEASYGAVFLEAHPTVVIEVAQVVGLTRQETAAIPVEHRTTFGVGQMIRQGLENGFRDFLIGLGGSSTNDCGTGLLAALGVEFFDQSGHKVDFVRNAQAMVSLPNGSFSNPQELSGIGTGLAGGFSKSESASSLVSSIAYIDFSNLDPRLTETRIKILSDVQNPLCGPTGATAVFGPQKGVRPAQIANLDREFRRIAAIADRWFVGLKKAKGAGGALKATSKNIVLSEKAGSGAAGGMGYALQLLGGEMYSGATTIGHLTGFDEALPTADWVITGEGCSDAQTLLGKAPCVVANRCRLCQVPVVLLSGSIHQDAVPLLMQHFNYCFDSQQLAGTSKPVERAAAQEILKSASRLIAKKLFF